MTDMASAHAILALADELERLADRQADTERAVFIRRNAWRTRRVAEYVASRCRPDTLQGAR